MLRKNKIDTKRKALLRKRQILQNRIDRLENLVSVEERKLMLTEFMLRRNNQHKYIEKIKNLTGCEICGKYHNPQELNFHHIDMSKKLFNISNIIREFKSWDLLYKELDKCIISCFDCHHSLHEEFPHLC